MSQNTFRNTVTGIKWNFIKALCQIILSFTVGIILARLIKPEDFGLFAITVIFIGFSALTSSLGVTPALIQRKKISHRSKRVAMTLSISIGFIIYLLFWILSPLIAIFFKIEELTLILSII